MSKRLFTLTVDIETTDNASMYEVGKAVEKCLRDGLYIYATTYCEPRPHHITSRPVYTFGYRVNRVVGVSVADVK